MGDSDTQFALVITVTYISTYAIVFLIASIVCAHKIRQIRKNRKKAQLQTQSISNNEKATEVEINEFNNDDITLEIESKTSETKKEKWYTPIKEWLRLVLEKKKVYLALIPHLFDQATDFGVVYQYYILSQTEDNRVLDTGSANPLNFFYASLFVILLHRIISTVAIYNLTRKWTDILLQIFDFMMVKAIWVNYKLNKKNKANPQRFLEILEATFESGPQLLISSAYILKASTNDSQQITVLIIISVLFSLWSITSRVTADDKVMFNQMKKKDSVLWTDISFKYNKCPCINLRYVLRVIIWRFLEVTNRVFICILIWINLGGFALSLILGIEAIWLLVLSIKNRVVDPMSSLMYLSPNISDESTMSYVLFVGFVLYRIISNFIYLILVTIFAMVQFETAKVEEYEIRNGITIESSFGLFMLIYAWITSCIWPCVGCYVFITCNDFASTGTFNGTTTRILSELISAYSFDDAVELIEFGIRSMTKKDIIKTEYSEYSKSSTFFIDQSMNNIGVSVNTLIVLKYIIDIAPESTDSEHMHSYPLELECQNGGSLIHLCVLLAQKKNASELLEEIIEYQNIDINSVNNDGQTALHCIVLKDHLFGIDVNSVKILLRNGINKYIKDNNGETALDIVQKQGIPMGENAELVQLLSD
eukprot:268642_1